MIAAQRISFTCRFLPTRGFGVLRSAASQRFRLILRFCWRVRRLNHRVVRHCWRREEGEKNQVFSHGDLLPIWNAEGKLKGQERVAEPALHLRAALDDHFSQKAETHPARMRYR